MKTINLTQGSPEWSAHRAKHFNASDAPAMLGCSPYTTRAQLIRARATGLAPDVDAATQRRFDNGHRFESLARPLAEKIVGEELYPVVGVEGPYSASFDGLTLLEDVAFEHKTLGKRLQDAMHDGCTGADLPEDYRAQMEHQCTVSGVERVLFMASNWADDGTLLEERHCWYTPDPEMRARLVAGWKQFAADLAAYTPEPAAAPAPVGRAPEALPALRIEVVGSVTASNLAEFKEHALGVLASINRDLQTDADFANAEQTVKWAKDVEDRLTAAKQHALSQTSTIDELFRTLDSIGAETRAVRLELDRLVKARKEEVREEIVRESRTAYDAHLRALNDRLGTPLLATAYRNVPDPDFGAAIKGKKNLDSMRDAVATALANGKIEASAIADRVQGNLALLRERQDLAFLFPDVRALATKEPDDLRAVIAARIAEHDAKEKARLDAERERIRAEEQARADAAARAERERIRAEEQAKAAAAAAPIAAPTAPPAPQLASVATAPAANAPQPGTPPTLRIGVIAARLGFALTADQLRGLGITPAGKDKAKVLFHESQFQQICDALIHRATQAKAEHMQRLAA